MYNDINFTIIEQQSIDCIFGMRNTQFACMRRKTYAN